MLEKHLSIFGICKLSQNIMKIFLRKIIVAQKIGHSGKILVLKTFGHFGNFCFAR